MINKYLKILIVLVGGLVVFNLLSLIPQDSPLGEIGGPNIKFNRFSSTNISSSIDVGPLELQLVASSSNRAYLEISHPGGATSQPVYLSFNGDNPAVSGEGIMLFASTTYKMIPGENLYSGAIRAVSSASTTLTITEINSDN